MEDPVTDQQPEPQYEEITYRRRKVRPRGRETAIPDFLLRRMLDLRIEGKSWNEIAAELTREGLVSPSGKREWTVSMVKVPLGQWALDRYVREEQERRAATSKR